MNYYEHHIGDYAEATAHLSFVEDAAYSRLIRKYYATEKPLPADVKATQRLVGARTKEEREAVDTVLNEFFELREDGWHQSRCDEELASYAETVPEREAKKENDRERQRRARERRRSLFEALRDHDIVPAFDTKTSELEAMLSRVSSQPVTRDITPPVTRDNTATQTPDTRHQTPEDQRLNPSPSAQDSSTAVPPTDLLGVKTPPADLAAKRAERVSVVTSDAIAAYNRILAKPEGLLRSVRTTVGIDARREQVRRCLKLASEICQELYGDSRVTPTFWTSYFESVQADDFHSGRGPYTGEHANWRPDFEFLTRKKTMQRIYERAVDEDDAEAAA